MVPGVQAHSYGTVTTPQLHWLVRETNAAQRGAEQQAHRHQDDSSGDQKGQSPAPSPPPLHVTANSAFFSSLAGAFSAFLHTCSSTTATAASGAASPLALPAPSLPPLLVDAANGVGGAALLQLLAVLRSEQGINLRVVVRNGGPGAAAPEGGMGRAGGGTGRLNDGVGADFVQKELQPPAGFSAEADASFRWAGGADAGSGGAPTKAQ